MLVVPGNRALASSHYFFVLPDDRSVTNCPVHRCTLVSRNDLVHAARQHEAFAIVDGKAMSSGPERKIMSPHDHAVAVGSVREVADADIQRALSLAVEGQRSWCDLKGATRATILDNAADLYEVNRDLLLALLIREAGKTLDNAQADLREAVDFLRYYALMARAQFSDAKVMPGPTGESNELTLHGRGVFACIAPWNFPLAIFTGQVAAALASGNAVLAKPAEQTPLVAHAAVRLLLDAGVPPRALHFLPGDGARIGGRLLGDARLAGVAFTGSNARQHLSQNRCSPDLARWPR